MKADRTTSVLIRVRMAWCRLLDVGAVVVLAVGSGGRDVGSSGCVAGTTGGARRRSVSVALMGCLDITASEGDSAGGVTTMAGGSVGGGVSASIAVTCS